MEALNPTSPGRWRSSLLRWGMLCCLLIPILIAAATASAQADIQQASEREIKAAYISKFGSYVEWPHQASEAAGDTFKIGVVGDDMLAGELTRMVAGRTVGGKPMSVQTLRPDDPIPALNVLFIGQAANDRLADILTATKGRPMLTISESPDALALGSMINFVIVDGRVRFEISTVTAEQAHLTISARLLTVAYRVVPGSRS